MTLSTFEKFFKHLDAMQLELDDDIIVRLYDAVDKVKLHDASRERIGKAVDELCAAVTIAATSIGVVLAVNELDKSEMMAVLCGDAELTVKHDDVVAIAETVLLPIVGSIISDDNANG